MGLSMMGSETHWIEHRPAADQGTNTHERQNSQIDSHDHQDSTKCIMQRGVHEGDYLRRCYQPECVWLQPSGPRLSYPGLILTWKAKESGLRCLISCRHLVMALSDKWQIGSLPTCKAVPDKGLSQPPCSIMQGSACVLDIRLHVSQAEADCVSSMGCTKTDAVYAGPCDPGAGVWTLERSAPHTRIERTSAN